MNSLQTIGVIGTGTMGRGSAQISAHAGLSVSMPAVNEQRVAHGHVEAAAALAKRLGKTPVMKDSPGDAMKRLLCRMPNEAVPAYPQGLASVEDIDKAMQLGCNHPDGPRALRNTIGPYVVFAVIEVFQHELHDSEYAMENYVVERLRTSFPDVLEGWPPA